MQLAAALLPLLTLVLADPLTSGPSVGQRFGPYSFLIATGPKRGTQHCYVCETGAKPAVIVFARSMPDPLGKLLVEVDHLINDKNEAGLFAWTTFLTDNEPALLPQVTEWGKKLGLSKLALGIFEDADGPPTYRLSRDAEVTILLVNQGKVVANYAFRAKELTTVQAAAVLDAVKLLVK
jgi:hypothetical protein